MHLLKRLISVLGAVTLAACGGGGDGGGQPVVNAVTTQSANTEILLKSGAEIVVDGTITSNKWLLESAEWQSFALTPNALNPDLTPFMRNQHCEVAARSDQASTILPGLGQSTWTCNLGIVGPPVSAETVYSLLLVGRDVQGQAQTVTKTLRVRP
jgi:hypothetical protein